SGTRSRRRARPARVEPPGRGAVGRRSAVSRAGPRRRRRGLAGGTGRGPARLATRPFLRQGLPPLPGTAEERVLLAVELLRGVGAKDVDPRIVREDHDRDRRAGLAPPVAPAESDLHPLAPRDGQELARDLLDVDVVLADLDHDLREENL